MQRRPGSRALAEVHRAAGGQVVTYGTSPGSDVMLADVRPDGAAGVAARLTLTGGSRGGLASVLVVGDGGSGHEALDLRLQVPGRTTR
ncbi:hypothetical protein NKG05_00225 [Oerskovia sp. M15]